MHIYRGGGGSLALVAPVARRHLPVVARAHVLDRILHIYIYIYIYIYISIYIYLYIYIYMRGGISLALVAPVPRRVHVLDGILRSEGIAPLTHGRVRPFHQKSTYPMQLTLGPNVVQIRSRKTLKFRGEDFIYIYIYICVSIYVQSEEIAPLTYDKESHRQYLTGNRSVDI